jgi:hypothetical protein
MAGYLSPEELEELAQAGMLGTGAKASKGDVEPPESAAPDAAKAVRPRATMAESAARGFGQGVTGGWLDEGAGWLGAQFPELDAEPYELIARWLEDAGPKQGRKYETIRDELRGFNKGAAQDNPKAFTGAEVFGDVLAGSALPGGAAAARKSSVFGGDALRRMGGTFIAGAGASEQEGAGVLEDALVTTAAGEGLRGVAKGLGAVYRRTGADKLVDRGAAALGEKLTHYSNESALKAAGAIQNNLQKLTEPRQQRIGQRLREEGVVTRYAGKRTVEKRAADLRQRSGAEMEGILSTADELTEKGVDWDAVAGRLRSFHNSLDPTRKDTVAPAINSILANIDEAKRRGGGFKMLHSMSSAMRQAFGKHVPEAAYDDALENRATQLVRNELESQLVPALEAYGNPRLMKKLWKESVGGSEAGIVGQDLGRRGVARELGNRTPSATDYVSAGATLAAGASPATAALAALGNMILRTRGRSFVAVGSADAADYAKKSLASDVNAFPDKLAKYGPLLARELQRGGEAGLWALDQSLLKFDEEYARARAEAVRAANDAGLAP